MFAGTCTYICVFGVVVNRLRMAGTKQLTDLFAGGVFLADVLNEESILKWYTEGNVAKGRSIFLEQMKKFVEWLKSAEEGEHLCTSP